MRVQCEQCAAAYSVADEKVAGRKLKQKCRKCGAQMLIDGTALAHDDTPMSTPTAPRAPSAQGEQGGQAIWHIALGDTTQGPYTLEELAQYYADGSVVLDTLVCRDGWNDWKPAGEVSELLDASRGPALVSMAPPAAGSLAAPTFGQPVTMGRDPFGDSGIESGPRVSLDEMQTSGAQRDGTVQFSMDQIRALSSVSAPSVPPPAPLQAGHVSDDSGLIDMRALAEAEAKAAAEAAHAALSPAGGNDGFRALRPSAIGPIQGLSPLTLVGGQRSQGLDFRTKVMASLAAFAVVVSAAVAIVVVLRGSQPAAAATPVAAAAPVAMAAAPVAAPAVALAAAVAPKALGARDTSAEDAADDGDDHGARKRGHRGSSHHARKGDDAPSAKSSDEGKGKSGDIDDILAKADAAPKKSSGAGASIDDLLDGAINGKRTAPKEEAKEPASSLPKSASRDEVFAALGRAKAKAASCKGKGVATAAITVTGKSGKATSVVVTGVDGAAKSCVEKAVRSTSFPKFQNDSLKVQFPFKLAG